MSDVWFPPPVDDDAEIVDPISDPPAPTGNGPWVDDDDYVCGWCLSKTCIDFMKCSGPTGPGIDEPRE